MAGITRATIGVLRLGGSISLLDSGKLVVRLFTLYVVPGVREDGILGICRVFFDKLPGLGIKEAHIPINANRHLSWRKIGTEYACLH